MSGVKIGGILRYDRKDNWLLHDHKHSRSRCKLATCTFFSHLYSKCKVNLCLTSTRNCFYEYHSQPSETKRKKALCQNVNSANLHDLQTTLSIKMCCKRHFPSKCAEFNTYFMNRFGLQFLIFPKFHHIIQLAAHESSTNSYFRDAKHDIAPVSYESALIPCISQMYQI